MKKSDIHILIIEDDASMREVLTEAVKRKGYRAIAIAKPDEAESLVKLKPIHGLIVDVMLPGRNGVDLVAKLKENLIEGAAIIFISGIYKDKSFALESMKKVDALDYMVKPFPIDQLMQKLDEKVSEYLEAPKVDLHSLLSSPFASHRDRRKALDHVEELCGYDLPFVFCILLDSGDSGYLNLVDENQNIYGVTIAKGTISKFDSESTILLTKKILLQHGFVTEADLSETKSKSVGADLVKSLVDEGLMSPHAVGIIKSETIVQEIMKLITSTKLKINFVPDRKIKADPTGVDAASFLRPLHDIIEKHVPLDWLKSFYQMWSGHPIRLGPQFSDHHQFVSMPILKRVEGVIEFFKKESTMEEIISASSQYNENDFYKALHFLMLRRILVFEEAKRVKNIDEHVARLKVIYNEIKNKNPVDIFKYFGLTNTLKATEVARVYKEFAKSHHPDTLPSSVSAEIRALNHELFAKVTSAYEILSDDTKKEKYFNEIKQQEAELQIKSDEYVSSAAQLLSRGKYIDALSLLQQANQLYESERSLLHYWWAKLKVNPKMPPEEVDKIASRMKDVSQGMRKSSVWIFVGALLKKYYGDVAGAEADLNRVIALDEGFMDARRELTLLSGKKPIKLNAENILTGDLSAVFKGILNRKKGA